MKLLYRRWRFLILHATLRKFWQKYFCLDFCLVAGCISLFCVVIGLACKIMVEDAWADGMQVFIFTHFESNKLLFCSFNFLLWNLNDKFMKNMDHIEVHINSFTDIILSLNSNLPIFFVFRLSRKESIVVWLMVNSES